MKNISARRFSGKNLVLRQFESKDREQLVRVIDCVCAESEWMAKKRFTSTRSWLHAFSEPACAFHLLLVAESNGKLAGWCRLFPEKCEYFETCELGIGILPDYRYKKIGSGFVETALKWARNIGVKRIDLSVHADNHIAVYLFKKFNFEVVSTNSSKLFLMSANV